jgi:hypothetical protein
MKEIEKLKFWLLQISKLASDTPEFYNPLDVAGVKKMRDFVLKHREEFTPGYEKPDCFNCTHFFTNPFDEYLCDIGKKGTRVCKKFNKK